MPTLIPRLYCSHSFSPHFNLACEEWLFRTRADNEIIFFTYRNDSSVVLGRNQNPWLEADPGVLRERGVSLVRRMSGGGTVYHDRGNVNYCFIVPRFLYDPDRFTASVVTILRQLGVSATKCERRTVWVGQRKVSGTAFMLAGQTAMLHGCLLVDTDLDCLQACLKPAGGMSLHGNAVQSIRSDVANLNERDPRITCDAVTESLRDAFCREFGEGPFVTLDPHSMESLSRAGFRDFTQKYSSQAWIIGRCPDFSALFADPVDKRIEVLIHTRRALVTELQIFDRFSCSDSALFKTQVTREIQLDFEPRAVAAFLRAELRRMQMDEAHRRAALDAVACIQTFDNFA